LDNFSRDTRFAVHPFTRQVEGDEAVIGRPDTSVFVAVPVEALDILDRLAAGETVGEAQSAFAAAHGGEVPDLEDFLATLERKGLVRRLGPGGKPEGVDEPAGLPRKQTFHFQSFPLPVARALFGKTALLVYGSLIALALAVAVREPSILPDWRAFYFPDRFLLMIVLMMPLHLFAIFLHEMAHLVAARALGVPARLGIGNRLWYLVAETDMTGIWSVPRRRRYLPILAGPIVDMVSASMLLVFLYFQSKGLIHLPETGLLLGRALLLRYVLSLVWQLYFFVQTDFYYLIANAFGCKNLMKDTETFLRNLAARMVGRPARQDQSHIPAREMRVVRAYSAVWLLGRAVSLAVLFAVQIPLLWSYSQLLAASAGPAAGRPGAAAVIVALTALLSLAAGFWLWTRSLLKTRRKS
jgi:putative peptide zinc metalloprotease protein